ncbi:MAG: hypothetical protein M1568_03290 [Acidobacteria bacterium]|jgi:hypothetical protein|nr:hypothetical protein [Acidobacteriota bacterium]
MKPLTLDQIVDAYISNYRAAARAEMDTFRREKSRVVAIRRAALCESSNGRRHPHQCLIPRRLLEIAEERLQAAAKRLGATADFEALHEIVKLEIGSIPGIGKLTVYDIAQRIGAYLGKSPTLIYLHRGTKEGAAILGFHGETLDARNLPSAFLRLSPAEIEDCLCIYKDHLRGVPTQSHRDPVGCDVARKQGRACR